MTDGVELATAYVSLVVDGKKVGPGVKKSLSGVDAEARRTGTRAGRLLGDGVSKGSSRGLGLVSSGLARTFGATAVVGAIGKTIGLAKNFDLTMRQIAVQTGQTGDGLEHLSALALQMGKDTVFSAQDAGDAMLELAKGGLTAAQIKAGALKTTLTLAAAGGLELGDAATYVTQGMTTFGLKAGQANRVAVALAGGANASTASVDSLGQALRQVGPGARNAGVNLEDTVAVLSAFDNAGIKGSDAGTSFKTMLARLVPQTVNARNAMDDYNLSFVNADGSFKSVTQIAQQLQDRLGGLTESKRADTLQTIFGSDATRAATVLMGLGTKGLDKYRKATRNTETVQKMANTTMGGASGAWENFKGSVETAAIQLGTKALPLVEDAANKGADFVSEAMTWGPALKDTFGPAVESAGDLFDAVKPLAGLAIGTAKVFGDLPGPVKSLAAEAAIAAIVFPRLARGVQSAGSSFLFSAARARQFAAEMTYAETRAAHVDRIVSGLKTGGGVAGMVALADASHRTSGGLKEVETIGGAALLGFSVGGPIGAAVVGGGTALFRLGRAGTRAGRLIEDARAPIGSIIATLDKVTGAATKTTRALTFNTITQQDGFKILNHAKSLYSGLNVSQRDLVDASMGNVAAQKRVSAAFADANRNAQALAHNGGADAFNRAKDLQIATKDLNKILGVNSKRLAESGQKTRDLHRATAPAAQLLREGMTAAAKNSSRTLRDLSTASRGSAKSVDALGGAVKHVPPKKKVHIDAPTSEARNQVSFLQRAIDLLHGKTVKVQADVAANVGGAGRLAHRAGGGPAFPGHTYLVGEYKPEVFTPSSSGRIDPVPSRRSGGPRSGDRWEMVLDDGTKLGGYIRRQADGRVAAHAGVNRESTRSQRRRA